MQKEIEAILAPAKAQGLDAGCEQMGSLWCVWVGSHGGGRANGVSLARDLMLNAIQPPKLPKPVPQPKRSEPVQVGHMEEPEDIAIPAFLKEPEPPKETIPEAIADLVRENEPYGEAKARLMALYISLQNKLMLGLASEAEGRTHTRLHGHLAWMARGAADVTI